MCVDCSVSRKKNEWRRVVLWGKARMSGVYWILNVFKLHQFQWQQDLFFFDPVEMNPLISKTRAVGQPLMSAAILSLTGRSTEFDLVFSIRVTEEVSLCISLCKKVTVVISSVKAERVTPMSCVGVWCPLKQSQAYFHTKIIHVKIQLATYCSHSICINFKDEWQLQYLRRLAPLPCQWTILYKTIFSIYFWGAGM